jgi:glycine hydroxymethyltransferase
VIDGTVMPGMQGGPLMHVIAAKAVALKENLEPDYRDYCLRIIRNAQALAGRLIEHGYSLVSGGTDNHLILVDLTDKNLTGKAATSALERAGITVNKNMVPFDTKGPMVTSGIRVGTPALTTRGMNEAEMRKIADFIHQTLRDPENEASLLNLRQQVRELCDAFPIYRELVQ